MVGGSTPPWCTAVLVLISLLPLLDALLRRLTRGNSANKADQPGKGRGMGEVLAAILQVASNIACSALSTVLLTGLAAQT